MVIIWAAKIGITWQLKLLKRVKKGKFQPKMVKKHPKNVKNA